MDTAYLLIAAAVVVLVIGAVYGRRERNAQRLRIENDVRQAMLTRLVGFIDEAFADPALTNDDVETLAAALIDQMQAYNVDGQLDAFIADNEVAVLERLAARRAASP